MVDYERVAEMYDEGYSDREIAEMGICSLASVSNWRKKNDKQSVTKNRKRLIDSEMKNVDEICARYECNKVEKSELVRLGILIKRPLHQINQSDLDLWLREMNKDLVRTHVVCRFATSFMAGRVLAASNWTCSRCGNDGKLIVHHIKGILSIRDEDLIAICDACHKKSHDGHTRGLGYGGEKKKKNPEKSIDGNCPYCEKYLKQLQQHIDRMHRQCQFCNEFRGSDREQYGHQCKEKMASIKNVREHVKEMERRDVEFVQKYGKIINGRRCINYPKYTCWECRQEIMIILVDTSDLTDIGEEELTRKEMEASTEIEIVRKILSEKYPFYGKWYSKTRECEVWSNKCNHCGAIQGKWFVEVELDWLMGKVSNEWNPFMLKAWESKEE